MHVGARFALGWNPVDRAHRFAINKDHTLVAGSNRGQEFLHDERLPVDPGKHFMQRCQVAIVRTKAKHPGAAIAVKRLEDHIAMGLLECSQLINIARNHCRRGQIWESQNEQLLR